MAVPARELGFHAYAVLSKTVGSVKKSSTGRLNHFLPIERQLRELMS